MAAPAWCAIDRQARPRLAANDRFADGMRGCIGLQTDAGAPQTTSNTRSRRHSFNAGVLVTR